MNLNIMQFQDRDSGEDRYRIVLQLGAGLSMAARPQDSTEGAYSTAKEICRRLSLPHFTCPNGTKVVI